MNAKFEQIAVEIVKTYMQVKGESERAKHNMNWLDYDYELNDLNNMVNAVENIANRLAENAKNRIVQFDNENLDREIIKVLTE